MLGSSSMDGIPEPLAALLFVLGVGAVFAAAGIEAALLLLRRRQAPRPETAARRWRRRGTLAAAGSGLLCIGWGFLVEPGFPEVTRLRVESPALRPGSDPIRVVHLTDLHCDPEPRLEERLPALVAAERPDLLLFTGDAANSPEGLPLFRRTLAALAGTAPTFAVKGNWDAHYFPDLERFEGTGAVELDGTARVLEVRGTKVAVAGVGWGGDGTGAALAGLPRDAVTIFLCHSPDQALRADGLLGTMVDPPLAS